ncbi:TonB-dependent receptor, partial [Acinetobacter baumannii]
METYNHKDFFGNKVDAQIYYRDFFTRFSPFDARKNPNRGGNVDQIYQENNILGSRLTVTTPLEFLGDTSLVWGGDFSREKSEMPLDTFNPDIYDQSSGLEFVKTGKLIYLPELTTQSVGGFVQLKHRFNDQWSAEAGTRYEDSYAMHVGGLFLFEIPENAPETFVHDLVEEIRQSKSIPVPPFNNRLNGLFWDEDEEFDIDHHFRHIALPHPGRIRELLVYISQQHSSLIDRAKPLWTCDIIEGIEGNRFAMYFKIHHAMVDGVAGMRLIEKSLSK